MSVNLVFIVAANKLKCGRSAIKGQAGACRGRSREGIAWAAFSRGLRASLRGRWLLGRVQGPGHPLCQPPRGSSLGTTGRGQRLLLFLRHRVPRTPCCWSRGERVPGSSRRRGRCAGWRGCSCWRKEPMTAGSSARLKRRPCRSPAPWRPAGWPRRHRAVLAGHQLGAALMSGPCRDDFRRQASASSGCGAIALPPPCPRGVPVPEDAGAAAGQDEGLMGRKGNQIFLRGSDVGLRRHSGGSDAKGVPFLP